MLSWTELEGSTRRVFLLVLSLAPGLAFPATSARHGGPRRDAIPLHETHIAGMAYYDLAQRRNNIGVGDRLNLIREPDNHHDRRVVAVWLVGGAKLGFVPRAQNQPIAALLDAGETLTAAISKIGADHWTQTRIIVTYSL